jgi:hypothetical protein
MSFKFPETNLIISGLSLVTALGGLVANNGLAPLIDSLGPYGHLAVSTITGLAMISAAITAQLSTPVTVPKSDVPTAVKAVPVADTLAGEASAAKAKVEAVEAVTKTIAGIAKPASFESTVQSIVPLVPMVLKK